MNIMNRLAWRSLWKNRTRTLVTIVGVILSAAMFAAVATLGVSLRQYMVDITIYNTGDYFIRFDNANAEEVAAIQAREEISQLGIAKTLGYVNVGTEEKNQSYILTALDASAFEMRTILLKKGRLPEAPGEIAVPEHCLWYLQAMGMAGELGETVSFDVVPRYEDEYYYDHMPEFPISDIPNFTENYVIVGILDNESSRMGDWSMEPMNFITVDDGTHAFHWARLFAKTADPMDAYPLEVENLSPSCSLNFNLLNYYGASRYTNINDLIYTVCAILMVIILACSVSLIYNAFSISLTERAKDFGLLSSVGATKKQLRRSVYFEALALSIIGVPLGILCGYFGIAVTLYLTGDLITGLLAGSLQSGVIFRAVPSLPAFGCAGVVAVVTVLISAWLPLKKAMKLDPISSIRQNGDYQIPKKLRSGSITGKFFGVPGLMSAKYYSVSRKKYRSTVISLTLSVIIFLTSVGFTGIFTELAGENSNTSNYDFRITTTPERYEEIRNLDFVEKSAMVWHESYEGILTSGTYTAEHLEIMEKLAASGLYISPGLSPNVYFLEDAQFRTYLQEQGIDPEPYFQGDIPRAVCLRSKGTIYIDHEDGTFDRVTMTAPVFETVPAVIDVYSSQLSSRLIELIFSFGGGMSFEYTDWEGHLIQTFDISDGQVPEEYPVNSDGTISFIRIPRTTEDGSIVEDFHYFSLDTMTVGEYLLTEENLPVLPDIEVLDQVDDLPFGVDGYSHCNSLVLLLPESWLFENCIDSLKVKTSDYHAMIAWLRSNLEEYEYQDLLESQIQYRNMMTMIHVFSYGFIILVSLICVCNVFNTISTNIALRRRDFGMLRSVGMQERQLRRMLGLECARYGVRSLLWGLPIGVGAGYGIYRLLDLGSGFPYRFPWLPVSAAVAAVFVIVFITMFYAVSKLRKDNPIEAIRVSTL